MKKLIAVLFLIVTTFVESQSLYFPPLTGTQWDTVSPVALGWCPDKIDTLINFLGQKNTKGFILLQDGKIAIEHYYGSFTKDSIWYWASAGKSLCGFLVGIAQEEGLLNINDSTSKYLGAGWTSCTAADEGLITIQHQLTMTSGFDDGVPNPDCTIDSCLVCIAQPSTRWAYHNAPYTLLHNVVANAAGITFNSFTQSRVASHTGMAGLWISAGNNDIYYSTARTMARFGLLILNNGIWNGDTLLHDTAYFNQMKNTSQNLNESYGYLWWLNGKNSFMVPGLQFVFQGSLFPAAPADMFAALGKNDQKIHVIPSKNMVLVRMGNAADSSLAAPTTFDNDLWIRLNDVFCNAADIHSNAESSIYIYPNPATDQLLIETRNGETLKTITISDITGKVVFETSGQPAPCRINIKNFLRGSYFIRVLSGNSSVAEKFIRL